MDEEEKQVPETFALKSNIYETDGPNYLSLLSILMIVSKGLVPFTQLVKVRRVNWFCHFQASDFRATKYE